MRLPLAIFALGALAACSEAPEDAPVEEEEAPAKEVEAVGGEVAQFGNGVKLVESNASVAETVERLEEVLAMNDFIIVAKVDHQANAEGAELELPPTMTIIFGKPAVGSPLMQAAPVTALDLPQKMAIYEDAEGKVMLAYNSPVWLASRHNIEGQDERLDMMATTLEALAMMAAGKNDSADPLAPDGPGDAPLMMEEETE